MLSNINKKPNRREIIRSAIASAGILATATKAVASSNGRGITFTHGVASGDPLHDRVILWTRVLNLDDTAKNIHGQWQVSREHTFTTLERNGPFTTGPVRDYTVKIDATGLESGTSYYYRFLVEDEISATGTTRTLPEQVDAIKLAVISCANYSHGYFHVYKEVAARDFHAVLHLGDYIYEYGIGTYENAEAVKQGRIAKPKTEAITLDDYRTRYALYRNDPDLLAAHAAHPFICVWDDHEVANDSWKDGAKNHNEGEGVYSVRQQAAMQAYREWLPIRETADVLANKIYRSFELAQFATLIMMDTRHIGRDKPLDYETDLPFRTIPFNMTNPDAPVAILNEAARSGVAKDKIQYITVPFDLSGEKAAPVTDWAILKNLDPKNLPQGYTYLPDAEKFKKTVLGDESRTILGFEQEEWLDKELSKSSKTGKPWQILGQQLLTGKLGIPHLEENELNYEKSQFITPKIMAFFRMLGKMGLPLNLDAWDGYPACRERVFDTISKKATNAVFLAGDTHNAWAFNLKDKAGDSVAVELGTASVSSPGLETYIPANPMRVAEELKVTSPELQYVNSQDRGWLELTITAEDLLAQWCFVSTVIQKSYAVIDGPQMKVEAGQHTLTTK